MAVRDHFRALIEPEMLAHAVGRHLHQPVDVEVARARDVTLPRVARLAERFRRTRAACARRGSGRSPRRPASSSISISLTARRTVATSAATDGRCSSSLEPRRDPPRQRDAEQVAGADHPRCVRDVGEEALTDGERLEPRRELVRVAAAERVVVVAEAVVEAVHEQPRLRALGSACGQERRARDNARRGTP